MTKITLFSGEIFTPAVGLGVFDPLAKFEQFSFVYSRNVEGGLKFLKGSRDPDHAPFRRNFHPVDEPCHTRPICQISRV